jgi:tripartite-type tricarboxylate transporter receptor subunit TctC
MHKISRRALAAFATVRPTLTALALATPLLAAAQSTTWPTMTVKLLDAFPPGAPGDLIARLIQPALQKELGQPVIVDNKPGAGGNIGAAEVVRATDGHTVLVGPDTMLTINPHIYKKLSFDPMVDLVPVTQLATFSQELVCNPALGVKNRDQLLATARKQPLSYASGGPGVPGHMAMELLLSSTHVQMQHVPYRGPAPAAQDVLGNNIPCGFLASPVVGPHVKQGRLVAIAVSGTTRLPAQPTVPTMAEAGVKGYDATFTEMMAMPKSTPPAVLQRLQRAVAQAMADPDVRAKMAAADLEPLANTPAEAAARIRAENARWKPVAARLDLRLD